MLQNNVIYEGIIAYKITFVPKGFFLVIIEPFFSIEGSLELSKEPICFI